MPGQSSVRQERHLFQRARLRVYDGVETPCQGRYVLGLWHRDPGSNLVMLLSVPVSAQMCAAADAIMTSSQCGVLVPNISTLCSMLPIAMTFVGKAKFRIWYT